MEEAAGRPPGPRGTTLPPVVDRLVPSPHDVILGAALVTPVVIHIPDYDFWWHLAAGRWILDHGRLPESDPFSFTRAGVPWTAHEWIPEVLFAAMTARFGLDSILLLKGLATGLTMLFLWVALARLLPSALLRLLLGVVSLALLVPTFTPRPWMLSFACLAALLLAWQEGCRGGRLSPAASAAAMGVLLALWINLHGMFVIGHLWLGAQVAGAVIDRLRGRELDVARDVARPLGAMGIGALGSLLHPLGPAMLLYPLEYQFTPTHETILEWFPPDLASIYGRLLVATYVAALAILVRGRPGSPAWCTFLLFSYLAFTSRRNVALLGIAAAPAVAEALGNLLARPRPAAAATGHLGAIAAFLRRRVDNFDAVARTKAASGFTPAIALLLVVYFLALNPAPADALFRGPMFPKMFPIEGTRWLLARGAPEEMRVFNFYGWGGYLIHESAGKLPTFIDGRADLFGLEYIQEYHAVTSLTPRWSQVLDEHRIDTVFFPKDHALCRLLEVSPLWTKAYEDGVAAAFVRAARSQTAGSTSSSTVREERRISRSPGTVAPGARASRST